MLLTHVIDSTGYGIPTPEGTGVGALVESVVLWLVLVAEIIAAILILIGIVSTLARMIHVLGRPKFQGYEEARLTLARFLALALEFQLAADVLATAVAPTWTQIGKLGAVALIRTGLNYFLAPEIKEEEQVTRDPNPLVAGQKSES